VKIKYAQHELFDIKRSIKLNDKKRNKINTGISSFNTRMFEQKI
jgi:hypothetical protein